MTEVVELAFPFTGTWLVQNSPADRVPSHGTRRFATSHAIDFVPVDPAGRSAPFTLTSLLRAEPPERFTGFGRPILAPGPGVVIATHDGEPDHHAVRGFPSVGYALTQGRRAARGWAALAGNHVVIEIGPGVLVALCHLRAGSVSVAVGQDVLAGSKVGQCGNSGNSTQPHVHVQAMDRLDPESATALPIRFPTGLPRNGQVVTAPEAAPGSGGPAG
ncbi:M23 family metallopeptidase [Intrasporangium sp.]|uniref:M23 family metallopeptidase n=1 Tax=Intrasporangium sp. TaxID=1925024 RepID=UPI00322151EF